MPPCPQKERVASGSASRSAAECAVGAAFGSGGASGWRPHDVRMASEPMRVKKPSWSTASPSFAIAQRTSAWLAAAKFRTASIFPAARMPGFSASVEMPSSCATRMRHGSPRAGRISSAFARCA